MPIFLKNRLLWLVGVVALSSVAFAGSINLVNDSHYTLRALIRGGDGSYLGEVVLNPEHNIRWTDTYGQVGQFGKGSVYRERSTKSQTPYEVLWFCTSGQDFSVNHNVPTGMSVYAMRGDGRKICSQEKKEREYITPDNLKKDEE